MKARIIVSIRSLRTSDDAHFPKQPLHLDASHKELTGSGQNRTLKFTRLDHAVLIFLLTVLLLVPVTTVFAETSFRARGDLVESPSAASAEFVVSSNVKLDNASTNYAVEPYVATSNGIIHVAWIGINDHGITEYFDQGPKLASSIWYSQSRDGGATFSVPILVSSGSDYYFDPSIAVSAAGDVYVAYLGYSSGVFVGHKTPSSDTFTTVTVESADTDDRPWITMDKNGGLYVAFENYNTGTMLATSMNGGRSFSAPAIVFSNGWPTGIAVDDHEVVHISMLGWSNYTIQPKPDQLWYARRAHGDVFKVSQLSSLDEPYQLSFATRKSFHPGPALAISGSDIYLVYSSNGGHSLYLLHSSDAGVSWSNPLALRTSTGLMEMPWAVVVNGVLVVAWRENASGYWNTYLATNIGGTFSPTKFSDHNGYGASVLNWHGDFLGVAILASNEVVVVWSDGRGLADYYGMGHIYLAVGTSSSAIPEFSVSQSVLILDLALSAALLAISSIIRAARHERIRTI